MLVGGARVYASSGGREHKEEQPVVVFVHGAAVDHTVWSLQARYFAHHGYRVLVLDLPGHGMSEGPLLQNIEGMAEWVFKVLNEAGIAGYSLIGHSMGALVTLEVAAQQPNRVNALALLAVSFPMMVSDVLLSHSKRDNQLAFELITDWGHSRRAQIGGSRTPGLWLPGGTLRLFQRAESQVLFSDLTACQGYKGGRDAASQIKCPTLILLGELDRMTPVASAVKLSSMIDDAEQVIIPGCGHMMMAEEPDRVLDALIEFI